MASVGVASRDTLVQSEPDERSEKRYQIEKLILSALSTMTAACGNGHAARSQH